MPLGSVALVIGKRGTGKSRLLRDLASRLRPDAVTVCCTRLIGADRYRRAFPQAAIEPGAFLGLRTDASVLILDDCLHTGAQWRQPAVRAAFLDPRTTVLVGMQFAHRLPLGVDFAILLREPDPGHRKRAYDLYARHVLCFEHLCAAMDELTSEHGCVVLDLRSRALSWYRAPGAVA